MSNNYLSLADLSRRAGLPHTNAVRLLRSGDLVPDAFCGKIALFEAGRANDLIFALRSGTFDQQRRRRVFDARRHDERFICGGPRAS